MSNPATAWWRNPRVRGRLAQVAVVSLVIALGWWIWDNTRTNLAQRGIAFGYDFLFDPAGFGILQSLIPYQESDPYWRVFVIGLLNTLLVSALGIVLATVLGFIAGIARLSKNALVSALAGGYIELIRNVPPLLQIFFWYFAVLRNLPAPRQSIAWFDSIFLNIRGLYVPAPVATSALSPFLLSLAAALIANLWLIRWARRRQEATGAQFPVLPVALALWLGLPTLIAWFFGPPVHWQFPELRGFNLAGGWTLIPELVALLVALSIYTSAFIAEIVRAGIQSVPQGQTEAAMALGLNARQRLRLVILPQAMRVIIPPLTSQYLNLTKNSSLAAAIGYPDLVGLFAGTVLNQTGRAIETIAMTMSVYLLISLSISLLMNWYNRRMALKER